jgi:hypothetical protein
MTTQIHIVNSSESNPAQHARVTLSRPGQEDKIVFLSPGESKAWWISGDAQGIGDKISVVEVFASKPKES